MYPVSGNRRRPRKCSDVRKWRRSWSRALELDPTGEDVAPHHPVPHEGVEGVGERRGAVLLEEEMPDPREEIAGDESADHVPGAARDQRRQQADDADRRSDEMQPPARPVAVLGEAERIELAE